MCSHPTGKTRSEAEQVYWRNVAGSSGRAARSAVRNHPGALYCSGSSTRQGAFGPTASTRNLYSPSVVEHEFSEVRTGHVTNITHLRDAL